MVEIEKVIGRQRQLVHGVRGAVSPHLRAELTTIDGVEEAIERIDAPTCVASSSSRQMVAFKLGLTDLLERFEAGCSPRTTWSTPNRRPTSSCSLRSQLESRRSRCAVIEDSVNGVLAGLEAGMDVFAYAGGVTGARQLTREGVIVFHEMRDLPDLLTSRYLVRGRRPVPTGPRSARCRPRRALIADARLPAASLSKERNSDGSTNSSSMTAQPSGPVHQVDPSVEEVV